jgi:hypothetical protein
MRRSLAIHEATAACPERSYRRITFQRESAHRHGIIVR